MILRGPRKAFDSSMVTARIEFDGKDLTLVTNARYLGLYVDSNLNSKEHISKGQRRAATGLSVLKHLVQDSPETACLQVYNAYVMASGILFVHLVWNV